MKRLFVCFLCASMLVLTGCQSYYANGWDNGYNEGYETGYDEGYSKGNYDYDPTGHKAYELGYEKGYHECYDKWYEDFDPTESHAYERGYSIGFDDGMRAIIDIIPKEHIGQLCKESEDIASIFEFYMNK